MSVEIFLITNLHSVDNKECMMKKLTLMAAILWGLGSTIQAFSAASDEPQKILAATCPENCSSCWEQCTKDDDCGSGHKCVSTPCGNRCEKE